MEILFFFAFYDVFKKKMLIYGIAVHKINAF